MAKNDNSYHAQKDKEQIKKLDQLLDELPKFCKTFFRGIEQTTSSSTRLGYAYDLRIFFNFIREKNPLYKNKELYEIDLTLFDHLDTVDIEDYLHYLQMYYKDDTEYMNKEQLKLLNKKIKILEQEVTTRIYYLSEKKEIQEEYEYETKKSR